MAASWSPTGLAYVEVKLRGGERREIGVLPTGSEKPVVFLEGANLLHPQFSPDGKWMAYMSDESRRNEVYVRAYPGPGPKSQISVDGGAGPVWRKDGREIFYIKNMGAGRFRILAVDVETNPAFKAGKPHIIFEDQFQHKGAHVRDYDLSPDGQHFIFIRAIDEPEKPLTEINVVLNWFRELQERVPVK